MAIENAPEETKRRYRESLLARLRKCSPGENYPLDPVERVLVIEALENAREQRR